MRGRLIALAGALALAACSSVAELSGPEKRPPADATAALRRKADEGLKEGRYADAWDLEAQAGTDRARLEAIAMGSLEAEKGPYEEMLKELRKKFGGLTPEARGRIDALAKKREDAGKWKDAAELQIIAADDPPKFAAAWAVYEKTPVKHALAVYEKIEKARKDFEEEQRTPPK